VILTGTPANSRPVQPGDVVDVEIEGIGRLSNPIVDAPAPLREVGAMPEDSQDARETAFAIR
jgi:5-oxopent-3-ene-1,2,5-tricarboxylate decarboxylase/2-hydroxyhepta-2,4-diene-1,7-dioate isomerase